MAEWTPTAGDVLDADDAIELRVLDGKTYTSTGVRSALSARVSRRSCRARYRALRAGTRPRRDRASGG